MPENTACPGVPWVSDPITDQEIAFAHLILSGTMNDRRAAEAVGLNPDTAAYTKSMPRVRAYMIEHRAAVTERLVDQEAAGLRTTWGSPAASTAVPCRSVWTPVIVKGNSWRFCLTSRASARPTLPYPIIASFKVRL